jgi:hypothetical protein
MESHELMSIFRSDVVDDVEPYLWGDVEAYQYMNDAYSMFVRLTGGIADGSSAVTTLTATADTKTTALSESILRIRTATNVTDQNRPVKIINVQDVETLTSEDYGVIRHINLVDTVGDVRYMIIGEEDAYVRWVNIPAVDTTIQLVVERLPVNPVCKPKQLFAGVGSEHHYHFLKWMRHLAYRKQDADTFNLVKSDQEKNDFVEYCELAKREKATRRHKVRTVAYGGI